MSLTERDLDRIEARLAPRFELIDQRFNRLETAILLMSLYFPGPTPTKESEVARRVRGVLGREEAVL